MDTGADETVFPEDVANAIGIDLTGMEERQISSSIALRPSAADTPQSSSRSPTVRETYEWTAVVGFVPPACGTTSSAMVAPCNSSMSSSEVLPAKRS